MTASERRSFNCTPLVDGEGAGPVILLKAPLSFWGGFDSASGCIREAGHPQYGLSLAGCVLLMAESKGSSSSASVLAEALRNGTGPAAIIMRTRDPIIGVGCMVATELYGIQVPIAMAHDAAWRQLTALAPATRISVCVRGEICEIARIEGSPDSSAVVFGT